MHHEIVVAFEAEGLDLNKTMCEMLDEHPSHRTERRGCGYTQATRFLSTYVNQLRSPVEAVDLGVFADWPKTQTEALGREAVGAGWKQGWRRLDLCDDALVARLAPAALVNSLTQLHAQLARIEAAMCHQENVLIVRVIRQLLAAESPAEPSMPEMREKPEIGSCSQAEEFFLEIAHGRVRRGGRVNIFVDAQNRPLLVEKMHLGESHSAVAVAPVSICGVTLPPGALFALRYSDDTPATRTVACGDVMPISAIEQARFLRLTTLTVPPDLRRRAFSAQLEAQVRGDMLSPLTTTIEDLRTFAVSRLASA